MSNIAIVQERGELSMLPADVLAAELTGFCRDGRFTGRYAGPERGEIEQTFEQRLARLFERAETPRLSGVQIKAPMYLTAGGVLAPAVTQPFTHILKPAGTGGFEAMPVVEWFCLALGREAGFEVPSAALIDMPEGMPPALVVERFDIRRGPDDARLLAMEDFSSVLDLPSSAKYDGTIERVARGLRPLSTDPAADLEALFRRALFAWLIADGDMHLKNLALLKVAAPGARRFATVRIAPLYDTVTTRVFPQLAVDRMALKLNGKDDRLSRVDFIALARTIDLATARAEAMISEMAASLRVALARLEPPELAKRETAASPVKAIRDIVIARIEGLG